MRYPTPNHVWEAYYLWNYLEYKSRRVKLTFEEMIQKKEAYKSYIDFTEYRASKLIIYGDN